MDFGKKFPTFAYTTTHHTHTATYAHSAKDNKHFRNQESIITRAAAANISQPSSHLSSGSSKEEQEEKKKLHKRIKNRQHHPQKYEQQWLTASNSNMKTLLFISLMLIMVLQDVTTVLAKPTTKATTTQAPIAVDRIPPMYESQLTVWPTDVDDIVEAVMTPIHTLIEQPVVVMPDMAANEEQQHDEIINNFADDDEDFDVVYDPSSDLWPTIIGEPEPTKPDPVIVLENYHHKYNNGSEEYKLMLSNGMVNYQRIDHVLVKGDWKPVQQGYYTVPSQGTRLLYQTTYYRADTNGYHVYRVEQSPRNPAYDSYLQYVKDQDKKLQKD